MTTQLTIPSISVTETDMQRAFYSAHSQRYELVATNLYLGWCGGEMDIFGLRKSGFIDEIEIKLSISDFKADFKKTIVIRDGPDKYYPGGVPRRKSKHEALKCGECECNYFSFYIPVEMVDKCEIPSHAGLYVFDPKNYWTKAEEVKKPKRLHSRKISDHNKYHTARKMHYRYWDMRMRKWRE